MHPGVSIRAAWALVAVCGLTVAAGCRDPKVKDQPPPSPDAGVPQVVLPSWKGERASRAWLREGFGEVNALAPVDLDGDGSMELVVGARGVALVDRNARAGAEPRWSMNWRHDPANILSGGENEWVEAMAQVDVNQDGVLDVIVTNSSREAYAVDALTGAELWHRNLDAPLYTSRLALLDADGDGVLDLFPSGGFAAYSGKTGAKLWDAVLPRAAIFVASAKNFDGQGGGDVLVTTELDTCVGDCPPPDPNAPVVTNVHAVSGTGAAVFDAYVPGTIQSAAAADVDGDGVDEGIVGTTEGKVHVLSASGEVWSALVGTGFVDRAVAADVDGDGRAEVFVALHELGSDIGEVVALSSSGVETWRHTIGGDAFALRVEQLDGDDTQELLVGAGDPEGTFGSAFALNVEPGAQARELWRVDVGAPVLSLATAQVDGERVVLLGARDSQVRAVEPATGNAVWRWAGGGYVFTTAAGDLDGDGADEVVSGDDRALIIASRNSDGARLWSRQLAVGNVGTATSVVVADLLPGGADEVVAAGLRFYQTKPGVVAAYLRDGSQVFSRLLDGQPWQVLVTDLEGDGPKEVVVAERAASGGCGVHVLSASGETRWRTFVSNCEAPTLAVGDVDGDGQQEIAYAELTLYTPPQVALLNAQGAIQWRVQPTEVGEDGAWVRIANGGVLYGGFAVNDQGHLTRRAAKDGALEWQRLVAPVAAGDGSLLGGGGFFGTAVEDLNGDGVLDFALTNDACELNVLSGAGGETLWSARLETLAREWNQRRHGGPVAYVPPQGTRPGWLAVGLYNGIRSHAEAQAFTLTGEPLGAFAMEGEAHAVAPMRFADGTRGAAVGAGLGVHALRLEVP